MKVSGFSLTELMLSQALALLLLLMLVSIYLSQKATYQWQHTVESQAEQARIALHIISRQLHQSYLSYVKPLPLPHVRSGHGLMPLPANIQQRIDLKSDILEINQLSEDSRSLLFDMESLQQVIIHSGLEVTPKACLLISNHKQFSYVRALASSDYSALNGQIIAFADPLESTYQRHALLSRIENVRFYIGKNKDHTKSLYRQSPDGRNEALVEGIDAMHCRFAMNKGGQLMLVSAEEVSDWYQVQGVEVSLEMAVPQRFKNRLRTYLRYVALHV